MLLAIDGPAGAGKSTVARATAHALGYTYLDSGAMYRAVALAGDRDPASLQIAFDGDRVLLDGEDVSDAIRTPEISDLASRRAADPAVRAVLLDKQRALLSRGDWVAEGRDIGTVVAPGADVKVWLTASLQERAERRGQPEDEVRSARRARPRRATTARWSPPATPSRSTRRASRSTTWSRASSPWCSDEGRGRRLSERRQVVARQPPDGVASRPSCTSARASRATATRSRASGTGGRFALIDTGGMDFLDPDPISGSIREQAQAALADAQAAILVVDARAGLRPGDEELADLLRRWRGGPVVDRGEQDRLGGRRAARAEFYALGLGDPIAVSAAQGLGHRRPARPRRRAAARGRRGADEEDDARPPGGRRAAERRQVDARQPLPRLRARDRLRRRGHDARRDRPAARGRRPPRDPRRHRRAAPPGEGPGLGRVLHDAALAAGGRARRRRARRLRRARRRHRPGPADRGARDAGGLRRPRSS